MFDYRNQQLRFIKEVIKEKIKQKAKYSAKFDDRHSPSLWGTLIADRASVLHMNFDWATSMIKIAALAWSACEAWQRKMETEKVAWGYKEYASIGVTSNRYVWGWGKTTEEAITDWVNKARHRWPDEHMHELRSFRTKEARSSDYIDKHAIDSMLDDAWQRYSDWHANNDPNAIWHDSDRDRTELIELIGDVIDGWFEAQECKWSHQRVPTNRVLQEHVVTIDPNTGKWTLNE